MEVLGAASGNDFEVNFLPDYRILHDAGYNVLTYDMRNLGQSGSANGGHGSGGRLEARDVIGSLHFARTDSRTAGMTIGLFSRCQGANATMFAMQEHPEEFADVRAMLAPQPLSVGGDDGADAGTAGDPGADRRPGARDAVGGQLPLRRDDADPLGQERHHPDLPLPGAR